MRRDRRCRSSVSRDVDRRGVSGGRWGSATRGAEDGIAISNLRRKSLFVLSQWVVVVIATTTFLCFGVDRGFCQQQALTTAGPKHIRINCGGGPLNDSNGVAWDADTLEGAAGTHIFPEINSSNPMSSYREFEAGSGLYRIPVPANSYYRVLLLFLFRTNETIEQEKILRVSIQGLEAETIPRWKNASGIDLSTVGLEAVATPLVLYASEYVLFCGASNITITLDRTHASPPVLPRISVIHILQLPAGMSVLQQPSCKVRSDVVLMTWHRRNCGGKAVLDPEGFVWEGDLEETVDNLRSVVSLQSIQSAGEITNDTGADTDVPWVPRDVWSSARISQPRTPLVYHAQLDIAERFFVVVYFAPVVWKGVVPGSRITFTLGGLMTQKITRSVERRHATLIPLTRTTTNLELRMTIDEDTGDADRASINGLEVIKVIPTRGLTPDLEVQALRGILAATGRSLDDADPCLTPSPASEEISCGVNNGNYTIIGLARLNQAACNLNGAKVGLTQIPLDIFNLTRLETLYLNSSCFAGGIPDENYWLRTKSLKAVNLSSNALEGRIPDFTTVLPYLTDLNLENNNLSGPVPFGLTKSPGLNLTSGNPFLCGPFEHCTVYQPQPNKQGPSPPPPSPPLVINKEKSSNWTVPKIVSLGAGGLAALIVTTALAVVIGKRMARRPVLMIPRPVNPAATSSTVASDQTPRNLIPASGGMDTRSTKSMPTQTMETGSNAGGSRPLPKFFARWHNWMAFQIAPWSRSSHHPTCPGINTSSEHGSRTPDLPFTVKRYQAEEIRQMISGATRLKMDDAAEVYMGLLNEKESVIIKMFRCKTADEVDAFRKEVIVLSQLHHRNLLMFLGCCARPGSEAIAFEGTGNVTLNEALHGLAVRTNPLLWSDRLDICIGLASAVAYLHTQVMPVVVHRNINPSNILIDRKMQPKLANFSFSRAMSDNTETGAVTVTDVKGTTGYVDPQYERTGNLTTASDIFSLGVVLLEILTGRHALVITGNRQIPIADWVRPLLEQGEIEKVLDPVLRPSAPKGLGSTGNLQTDLDTAWAIGECAILCCEPRVAHRPNITMIVNDLERIKKAIQRAGQSALGTGYSDQDSTASSTTSKHHPANPPSEESQFQGRYSQQ